MLAGLVHTPVARALSWALIHFLWEGAAVAALLAAALFVFRPASARVRYGLACVALCAMLAAPAVTLGILWPRIHLDAGVLIRSGTPPAARLAQSPTPDPPPAPRPDRLPWVAPLWMAGVLIFYLRTATSWAAVQRLRRRGTIVASAEWQERLRALARRLRVSRPVLMLESCLAETPAVVGYLRPAILIPAGLLTGLPPEQVEAILLHELAHIRRHDYAVNVLQTLVEGLLFYHPAVWWVSGVIRAERENCCDDAVVAVVGDARGYAAALAELEWRRSAGQPALAARGGNLTRRIRRLLEPEGPRSIAGPVLGATLLMASIAAGLMAWQPALPKAGRVDPTATPTAIPGDAAQEPLAPPAQSSERTPREELRAQLERPYQGWLAKPLVVQEAQLATPYEKWLAEDVVYIITPDEKAAFQRLQSNEEREQFIEQFWLRRDPTPGTVENEFKEEHYRRIAYANEHFTEGIIPGWKSHRGMYYIKFGPPDEIDDHRDSRPPFVAWTYHHMQPAPGAGWGTVVFTDVDGSGQFVLPAPTAASAIIMGSPPRSDFRNQTETVTFHVPSFGGPTAVYIRIIHEQSGANVVEAREEASAPQYSKSFQLQQQGSYRIQVFVQRPGEGVIALFPRGEGFGFMAVGRIDGPAVEREQAQAANVAAIAAAVAGSSARQQSDASARVSASDFDVTVGVKTLEPKPPNPTRDAVITVEAPGAGGKVEIYGQITTMARRIVNVFEEAVDATPGRPYQRTIPLNPGRYRLKLVVRDLMDGRIGAKEKDFEVQP
jgi:GWxTD domain-containing protein